MGELTVALPLHRLMSLLLKRTGSPKALLTSSPTW